MKSRTAALAELGEHVIQIAASMPGAWKQIQGAIGDPVALDKFALQCVTVSQALGQLGERSQELAEQLLDGDSD